MHQKNLTPIQDGEIVKLQKPLNNTFSDHVKNNDGIVLATCDNCKAENVNIEDHICKTLVTLPNASDMVTTIENFKKIIKENMFTTRKEFINSLNENSNNTELKTLEDNMYFVIKSSELRITKNSYNDGETGETTHSDTGLEKKQYKNVQEILDQIDSRLTSDSLTIMDDRIICSYLGGMSDDNNYVATDSLKYNQWKNDELELYTFDYDIVIEIVVKTNYTSQDLSNLLGIANYD